MSTESKDIAMYSTGIFCESMGMSKVLLQSDFRLCLVFDRLIVKKGWIVCILMTYFQNQLDPCNM